ncbi:MAG: flagellar biosynthesis protein FlhF [Spirochaetia bacterium]|jgi:flagellar biosynthesis protein FlhF|nr:flagellar biosynthesis protein FlhF [Spirochaetia bacterium]
MKYAKIKAKTYAEAMQRLRREYGDDAIPISHKNIKEGGLFKSTLFGKDVVEMTIGIPERRGELKPKPKAGLDITVGGRKDDINDILRSQGPSKLDAEIMEKINQIKGSSAKPASSISSISSSASSSTISSSMPYPEEREAATKKPALPQEHAGFNLEKELRQLKDAFNALAESKGGWKQSEKEEAPLIAKYLNILEQNDFNREESAAIMRGVKNSISNDDLQDSYKIEKSLKELLKSRIVTSGPIRLGNSKKKIIMFIGPTGVGKTTTMAKLGAIHSLKEGNRVVFITIDNYRIAATEQLRKYAEIIRIPIYAVNDSKEFKSVITNEKADIILVDTSGRSQKNQLKIAEMKNYADLIDYDFEKILCVSGNTRKNDLSDIFRAFDAINFNSVIITKVDETSNIGNVVDIADKYSKPISYFTNGQEVPNDIEVADSDKIVELMIGNINS